MTSEQQYYEAKVFLSAYKDALKTLDQAASNKAVLERSKALERYLLSSSKKGEIHVDGTGIREGTFFGESRIRKLGLFSKKLFAEKFPTFEGSSSYCELKKVLESYL